MTAYDVAENNHSIRQYLLPLQLQAERLAVEQAPADAFTPTNITESPLSAAANSLMAPPPAYIGGYQIGGSRQNLPVPNNNNSDSVASLGVPFAYSNTVPLSAYTEGNSNGVPLPPPPISRQLSGSSTVNVAENVSNNKISALSANTTFGPPLPFTPSGRQTSSANNSTDTTNFLPLSHPVKEISSVVPQQISSVAISSDSVTVLSGIPAVSAYAPPAMNAQPPVANRPAVSTFSGSSGTPSRVIRPGEF